MTSLPHISRIAALLLALLLTATACKRDVRDPAGAPTPGAPPAALDAAEAHAPATPDAPLPPVDADGQVQTAGGDPPRPETADGLPYSIDLDAMDLGALPDDGFLVLEGDWQVVQHGDARALMLPGTPVEQMGLVFGPDVRGAVELRVTVTAAAAGRRLPRFGIGVNGVGSYTLRLTPVAKKLELLRGDEVLAVGDFPHWTADHPVTLLLRLQPQGDQVQLHGVAQTTVPAPGGPYLQTVLDVKVDDQPFGGQAVIYAAPYASQPIYFTDIHFAHPAANPSPELPLR